MGSRRSCLTTHLDEHCLLEVVKQLAKTSPEATVDLIALSQTCKTLARAVDTQDVWELVEGGPETVSLIRTSHRLAKTARQALASFEWGTNAMESLLPVVQKIPLPNLRNLCVSKAWLCTHKPFANDSRNDTDCTCRLKPTSSL